MAVRIPQSLSTSLNRETGWDVLDYELREQKAQTLGNLGGQVEQALSALRAFDAAAHGTDGEDQRRTMLDEAADRVWAFMIQRELCGFRNWEAVVKDYGIPREVLNRVARSGARRTRHLPPGHRSTCNETFLSQRPEGLERAKFSQSGRSTNVGCQAPELLGGSERLGLGDGITPALALCPGIRKQKPPTSTHPLATPAHPGTRTCLLSSHMDTGICFITSRLRVHAVFTAECRGSWPSSVR